MTNQVPNTKNIATGTAWLTIMQIIDYAISFIFYMILARILPPKDIGNLSLLFSTMAIYNTLTMLALNNATIKFISEHYSKGETEFASAASQKILKLIITISITALIISYIITYTLAQQLQIDTWTTIITLTTAFILNLTNYYGGVMFGLGLFKQVSLQNIIYYITSRPLAITLILVGLGLTGVITGYLLGAITCLIYSILILKNKLQKTNKDYKLHKILSFSLPIYTNNIITLIQSWLDIIILSITTGPSITGKYYLAISSATPISILWMPLSSVLLPTLTSTFATIGKEQTEKTLIISSRIITYLILPISLALAATSPTALTIIYGETYQQVSIPFSIIVITSIILAHTSLYTSTLQALNDTKPIFTAGLTSTILYTIALTFLPTKIGATGAALSRTILIITNFIILKQAVKKHLNLTPNPITLLKTILMSITIFTPLTLIELLTQTHTIIKATYETLTFIILWIISTKLIKPLNNEDKYIINEILPHKLKFLSKII